MNKSLNIQKKEKEKRSIYHLVDVTLKCVISICKFFYNKINDNFSILAFLVFINWQVLYIDTKD